MDADSQMPTPNYDAAFDLTPIAEDPSDPPQQP
jgi:hypothetical protein